MSIIGWWRIKVLVKQYPNDAELGAKVRAYIQKSKELKNGIKN